MTHTHPTGPLLIAEHVLQDKPRPRRYVLVRKDLGAQREYLPGAGQMQVLDQEPDVLGIATTGREDLHREQMLRRRRRHPQPRVIEHPWSGRVATWGDVGAGLLVQPPCRKAQ